MTYMTVLWIVQEEHVNDQTITTQMWAALPYPTWIPASGLGGARECGGDVCWANLRKKNSSGSLIKNQ